MENTYQNERKMKRDGSWQQHSIANSYKLHSIYFCSINFSKRFDLVLANGNAMYTYVYSKYLHISII